MIKSLSSSFSDTTRNGSHSYNSPPRSPPTATSDTLNSTNVAGEGYILLQNTSSYPPSLLSTWSLNFDVYRCVPWTIFTLLLLVVLAIVVLLIKGTCTCSSENDVCCSSSCFPSGSVCCGGNHACPVGHFCCGDSDCCLDPVGNETQKLIERMTVVP
jgi:hypothetical protein